MIPHFPNAPGRLARAVVALGLLALPSIPGSWAQAGAPKLLSTEGGGGRRPWKDLAGLQQAAAAGNPEACWQLGLRCETGEQVPLDYEQARTLYEHAAAGGTAEAIYRLGRLYQEGLGVESDPIQARELYRLAALANVPLAQYNLGAMLVSARGGSRDYVEGLAWLIMASRNHIEGDGEQRVREHLAKQPEAIAAAEKRAEELGREVAARKGARPPWPVPATESGSSHPIAPAPPVAKPVCPSPKIDPPKFDLPPPPAMSDVAKPQIQVTVPPIAGRR